MDVSIGVIIPVYNVEKYLEECLDSILNQTVPFNEVIVVNDGSTDKSLDICRKYENKYMQFELINQQNCGPAEARNRGLDVVKSEYIVFVDSDDYIDNRFCEIIKKIINNKELDVIYYSASIQYEALVKISKEEYTRDKNVCDIETTGFESLKLLFPAAYQMSVCMSAYKRTFLKQQNIRFIRNILYEDRFFCLRVITEANKVMYIRNKIYIRRFRPDSIVTSSASKRKIGDVIYGHRKEWNYIRNRKEWKNDKDLTQYFVLCGALMTYQEEVSNQGMKRERERYLFAFFREWLEYFDFMSMDINMLVILLFLVKHVRDVGEKALLDLFREKGGIQGTIIRLSDLVKEQCEKQLKQIPLGKKCKIGIYGRGRHTTCILQLYNKLIGDIKAELYYIESDKKDEKKNTKRLDEISKDTERYTDFFLLSSKVYQTEMYINLKKKLIPETKIIKLYTANDAIDYVMIYDVLFE